MYVLEQNVVIVSMWTFLIMDWIEFIQEIQILVKSGKVLENIF